MHDEALLAVVLLLALWFAHHCTNKA